jgi:hypothetical protein
LRSWFVLKSFTLYYYERRDSKEPKGFMDLSGVGTNFLSEEAEREGKAPPTPHVLKMMLPGRNFQMCFHTEGDKAVWRSWFIRMEEMLFGPCSCHVVPCHVVPCHVCDQLHARMRFAFHRYACVGLTVRGALQVWRRRAWRASLPRLRASSCTSLSTTLARWCPCPRRPLASPLTKQLPPPLPPPPPPPLLLLLPLLPLSLHLAPVPVEVVPGQGQGLLTWKQRPTP